jgi:hypothetical protein
MGDILVQSGGSLSYNDNIQNTLSTCTQYDISNQWMVWDCQTSNTRPLSSRFLLQNTWLAGYSRTQSIVFDNREKFKQMCNNYGIISKLTTSQMCNNYGINSILTNCHNPKEDASIDRIHKMVNNMLI